MDAQQFLAEFGHIAGAPGGVQQLRDLILALAIKGNLVRQDESDEPASIQLEAINKISASHITIRGRKRPQAGYEINETEKYTHLPVGWAWVRLSQLVTVINGRAYSKQELLDKGTPVLRVGNLFTSNQWYHSDLELEDDKYCDVGDLLYAWSASFGPFIWSGSKVIYHYHIWKLDLFSEALLNKRFLYTFLLEKTQEIKAAGHGISMIHMTKEKMEQLVVALPPLKEQARIVAKVDELMALCDKLENQQKEELYLREKARKTVFNFLADASSSFELSKAWHRIESNLPRLLVARDDVDDLRQLILKLAFNGRLTSQTERVDTDILEQMQARKRQLASKKIIKRETATTDFPGIEEMLQAIPDQWIWCRLNDIASVVRGGSPRPAGDPKFYGGDIPFLKVADVTRSIGMFVEGHTSTITEAGLNKTREINERTVLLTNSGATLGVPGICTFRTTFNDGIAAFIELHEAVFDEYLYYYLKSKTKWLQDIASRGQGQPNLNTEIIRSMWFPLPPISEQREIVVRITVLMKICDKLTTQLAQAEKIAKATAIASSATFTGIYTEEEEALKTLKTELISTLRLVNNPNIKEQAPLAAILARHQSEMSAGDLWQRYGGEIDAFYAQLKQEVGKGWIAEPAIAEMRETEAG